MNAKEMERGQKTIAILGATRVDGTGVESITTAMVVIKNDLIDFIGTAEKGKIPKVTEVFDAEGMVPLLALLWPSLNGNSIKAIVVK